MQIKYEEKIEYISNHLTRAWKTGKGVQPATVLYPQLSIEEAYQVQLFMIEREIKNGQKVTGKKIGLTSKAMQELLGVDEPDYGHLLNSMEVRNGGAIPFNRVLQPKVEGELAFILKEDLSGPGVSTMDVLNATDAIVPALEIVDSRIKNWKITLADTIADNASSGLYVLGEKIKKLSDIDIKQIGMALYKNNELQNTGVGAAALGNPAKCVAWLANKLADYDITLKAGEVILSGALSAAIDAKPGDHFYAKFAQLGEVRVSFTE